MGENFSKSAGKTAGNSGALEPSGVEKVVDLYRRTLERPQEMKRAQLQTNGGAEDTSQWSGTDT